MWPVLYHGDEYSFNEIHEKHVNHANIEWQSIEFTHKDIVWNIRHLSSHTHTHYHWEDSEEEKSFFSAPSDTPWPCVDSRTRHEWYLLANDTLAVISGQRIQEKKYHYLLNGDTRSWIVGWGRWERVYGRHLWVTLQPFPYTAHTHFSVQIENCAPIVDGKWRERLAGWLRQSMFEDWTILSYPPLQQHTSESVKKTSGKDMDMITVKEKRERACQSWENRHSERLEIYSKQMFWFRW